MHILVVAATPFEIDALAKALACEPENDDRLRRGRCRAHDVDILITGVGMVATAAWCARTLAAARYDLAINLGVCGSFDPAVPLGSIVHVVEDCIAELGAEDGRAFLTIQDMRLLDDNEFPFNGGRLRNTEPPDLAPLRELTRVRGITVNTVHGEERSIAAVVDRFAPQVESMEGAAFMYACLIQRVPFAQVRAVSNIVERRNRQAWRMNEAISALADAGRRVLEHA